MKKNLFSVLLLGIVIIISGCTYPHRSGTIVSMREIKSPNYTLIPQDGKALIVFIRQPCESHMYQASLLKVTDDNPELVAILTAGAWTTFQVDPGKHFFMSSGYGSAPAFMNADLLANKTYYVLIKFWTNGWGLYRFYFNPVHREDPVSDDLQKILKDLRLVEKIPASEDWVRDNTQSLLEKQALYDKVISNKSEPITSHLQENDSW